AKYSDADDVDWLVKTLIQRRDIILRRYFRKLSPIGELAMSPDGDLCGTDLARYSHAFDDAGFKYSARVFTGAKFTPAGDANVKAQADGKVCVTLSHHASDGGVADEDASR